MLVGEQRVDRGDMGGFSPVVDLICVFLVGLSGRMYHVVNCARSSLCQFSYFLK